MHYGFDARDENIEYDEKSIWHIAAQVRMLLFFDETLPTSSNKQLSVQYREVYLYWYCNILCTTISSTICHHTTTVCIICS